MVKLIKTLALYGIYALLVGEVIVRFFALTSDIPNRTIDEDQVQKYIPNQSGTWHGGKHQWHTNDLGWAGPLPASYDNLITILGDSFIENFMNADECRQAYYLKNEMPERNYLEAARSGISLIEAMEITKQLDTLKPKYQLIYISDNDFEESISEIARRNDITQVSLEKIKLLYGRMKAPRLKKILYNWKFMYYLYLRFPLDFKKDIKPQINLNPQNVNSAAVHGKLYRELLIYIKKNYRIEDKILVFRPISSPELVLMAKEEGFETIFLDNHDEQWSFDDDHHWTCYGHQQAANQVAKVLKTIGN